MTERDGEAKVSYNPQSQYTTKEPQFRQPSPSEKDKISTNLTMALVFFFIAAIIFIIAGAYNLGIYAHLAPMSDTELRDYFGTAFKNATDSELAFQVLTYLIEGIVLLIFGVLALVMALFTRAKAILPMAKGEFEEAGRFLNIIMIMGFVFGLVIAGILVFKAKDLLKKSAVRMSGTSINISTSPTPTATSGEVHRCQVCNSMMAFNSQTRMWFCSSCNRYQM